MDNIHTVSVNLVSITDMATSPISDSPIPISSNPINDTEEGLTKSKKKFSRAVDYIKKVKEHLKDKPLVYSKFLDSLSKYQLSITSKAPERADWLFRPEDDFLSSVTELLKGESKLIDEFFEFLPESRRSLFSFELVRCNDFGASVKRSLLPFTLPFKLKADEQKRKAVQSLWNDNYIFTVKKQEKVTQDTPTREIVSIPNPLTECTSECPLFNVVRRVVNNDVVYEHFLRHIVLYMDGLIDYNALIVQVTKILGPHPTILSQFKSLCWDWEGESPRNGQKPESNNIPGRFDGFPSHGECPSYKRKHNGVTTDYSQVLNSTFVCTSAGNEDERRSSSQRKNYYDELLIKVHDERYAVDQDIMSVSHGIGYLGFVLGSVLAHEDPHSVSLPDSLGLESPVLIYQLLSRVYRESFPELVECILNKPSVVLPIVIDRLKVLYFDLLKRKADLLEEWNAVQKRAHLRAQDSQSAQFKTNDVKTFSRLYLCEDMKTRNQGIFKLEYSDPLVMEDAADLILYSIKTKDSSAHVGKVERILTSFIPHLFCISNGTDPRSCDIFYGGRQWYCFLRLHNLLCRRLTLLQNSACLNCSHDTSYEYTSERKMMSNRPEIRYIKCLGLVQQFIAGSVDWNKFEDGIRSNVGVNSFHIFTVDKLISAISKYLKRIVDAEFSNNSTNVRFMKTYSELSNNSQLVPDFDGVANFYKFLFAKNPLCIQISHVRSTKLPEKNNIPRLVTFKPSFTPFLERNLRQAYKSIKKRSSLDDYVHNELVFKQNDSKMEWNPTITFFRIKLGKSSWKESNNPKRLFIFDWLVHRSNNNFGL